MTRRTRSRGRSWRQFQSSVHQAAKSSRTARNSASTPRRMPASPSARCLDTRIGRYRRRHRPTSPIRSYEIALVLDTTGSMKGGKLASMKDAVLGLIGSMSVQVNDTDKLKFAVVPFSAFVNVGPNYGPSFDKKGKQIAGTGASWLDLRGNPTCRSRNSAPAPAASSSTTMSVRPGRAASRRAIRPARIMTSTTRRPIPAKPETLFIPAFGIDEPDTPHFINSYIALRRQAEGQVRRGKEEALGEIWCRQTDASGMPLLGGACSNCRCAQRLARTPVGKSIDQDRHQPIRPRRPAQGAGPWLRRAADHPDDQRLCQPEGQGGRAAGQRHDQHHGGRRLGQPRAVARPTVRRSAARRRPVWRRSWSC